MECTLRLLVVLVSKFFKGIITHQCSLCWQMKIDMEDGLDSGDIDLANDYHLASTCGKDDLYSTVFN